ncbi:KdsC family phosphatase [Patiriisocius marinus]|uniref:3-deoxy-D-manno-octulosonate 8-phosphate phosphatase n=1 Tax=Patiriisocius marinus TaxID=1397112 RepID=A0A5J4INS7_9FLAO|nr:HAD-IIIA family hydrolase [Patiriisocius marinus]GER59215.1 3-deoxy-D-manno-octulosonate 8-phosphate phosphatase [Patiriisocius marinus]
MSYKLKLNNITTFVFDVDGVLTDGSINITTNGEMYRTMNVKDGFALKEAMNKGFKMCIISGGSNEGVRKRLEGLGIKDVHLGTHDKVKTINEFVAKNNIDLKNVLYMGDDIPDYHVMQLVGLPVCPQDAVPEIKAMSQYVSHKNGGKGCVRDIIEQVLKVQHKWDFKMNISAKYD